MSEISSILNIEKSIILIKNVPVIIDSDVARFYGVETRDINKSVTNNPNKFPQGYVLELTKDEKAEVVEKFHHLNSLKYSSQLPKAFTEKGLYMLATILKSKKATQTTLQIIETFSKIKQLTKNVKTLQTETNKEKQKQLTKKSGEIIADIFDEGLENNESETSIELNLAVLKFKHIIKKGKKK